MFLICIMFLCFLCVLVIILNFMCCIGLCSNYFSYWVAHKQSICSLGTTRCTTFAIDRVAQKTAHFHLLDVKLI